MKIHITRPTPDDSVEINRLFAVTVRQAFEREGIYDASLIDAEIKAQCDTLHRAFSTDSVGRSEFFLVARDSKGNTTDSDGRIVGTVAFGPPNEIIRNESGMDVCDMPEVKSVYVLPKYQGQGIGSRLYTEILRRLAEGRIECFCLDSGYSHAQQFWRRRLGEPAVVLKDYFGRGAHHMIWQCRVGGVMSGVRSELTHLK